MTKVENYFYFKALSFYNIKYYILLCWSYFILIKVLIKTRCTASIINNY